MKYIFNLLRKLFGCKLSRVFFAANLAVCAAAFDWKESFAYFEKINAVGCKPKPPLMSFPLYDISGGGELIESLFLISIAALLFIILAVIVAPSLMVCGMLLSILKSAFPMLCDETFDLISVPVFLLVNGLYWILLGYLIESSYLLISQNSPTRKNSLSIYPKEPT